MSEIKVRVGQQNAIKVLSSLAGAGSLALSELTDVDASNLQNGMVLVYNSTTQKWTATLQLTPTNTQNLIVILSAGEVIATYLIPPLSTEQNFTQNIEQERQENLIYAAEKACHNLGLKEGIFYVEGIAQELGVKILGIQVCPANSDLREWLFEVWDFDLMLYSCLIACGFKPFVNKRR